MSRAHIEFERRKFRDLMTMLFGGFGTFLFLIGVLTGWGLLATPFITWNIPLLLAGVAFWLIGLFADWWSYLFYNPNKVKQ